MKGRGEGSHFMADNADPDEVYRDDAMLDQMDPSKLDKIEGLDARNKAVMELRNRLSKYHKESPKHKVHRDQGLSDCRMPAGTMERDQALADTAQVILDEWKSTFSITPKNPGTTKEIEHRITLKPGEKMPKSMPMFRRSLPHRKLIEEWVMWMLSHRMIRRSKATSFQVIEKPGKEPGLFRCPSGE
jgi:hypothetical protein